MLLNNILLVMHIAKQKVVQMPRTLSAMTEFPLRTEKQKKKKEHISFNNISDPEKSVRPERQRKRVKKC